MEQTRRMMIVHIRTLAGQQTLIFPSLHPRANEFGRQLFHSTSSTQHISSSEGGRVAFGGGFPVLPHLHRFPSRALSISAAA